MISKTTHNVSLCVDAFWEHLSSMNRNKWFNNECNLIQCKLTYVCMHTPAEPGNNTSTQNISISLYG